MTNDAPKPESRAHTTAVRQRFVRQMATLVLVAVLAALGSGGVAILYTKSGIQQSERQAREDTRRWCTILNSLDERYQKIPPPAPGATPAQLKSYQDAQKFQKQVHDLVIAYDCRVGG